MESATAQTLHVTVADWRYRRTVRVTDGTIEFQIARNHESCRVAEDETLCATCLGRVQKTELFLRAMDRLCTWKTDEDGRWLVIDRGGNVEDPLVFAANYVGLRIEGHAPAESQSQVVTGTTVLDGEREQRTVYTGWQNRRALFVEPHRLLFQVTLKCNHCSTCSHRRTTVSQAISRTDVPTSWQYLPGYGDIMWLEIRRVDAEDPIELLQRVIGIDIVDVAAAERRYQREETVRMVNGILWPLLGIGLVVGLVALYLMTVL